ncbi:MAG: hypothetical protein ACYDAY_02775 [Candidatus Dormibacteria bacterium]
MIRYTPGDMGRLGPSYHEVRQLLDMVTGMEEAVRFGGGLGADWELEPDADEEPSMRVVICHLDGTPLMAVRVTLPLGLMLLEAAADLTGCELERRPWRVEFASLWDELQPKLLH